MENKSVWKDSGLNYPAIEAGDRDIVVIGGGIAGFLCAYYLSEAGRKVTLIEADRLFSGTTKNTTAKITYNQGDVYADLYTRYGRLAAELYYKSQAEAMEEYKSLVEKYGIDCDFEEMDGYIFSKQDSRALKKSCELLQSFGADCELCGNTDYVDSKIALKAAGQYVFDPLKFLSALPVNFEIFENTRAIDVDPKTKLIQTDGGFIKANKIIIATHFPIINSRGAYYFKLRQSTSYTVAVNGKKADAMYLDEKDDGLSIRPFYGGSILGGGDHRTGRAKECGHFTNLERTAKELFGGEVTHRWHAEDVMTFDGMPMAGRYSKTTEGIYVVTGFNKWGMTNALVCAKIIRDKILGKENEYARLFSPQRKIKGAAGDIISNAFTNIKEIALGYFRITFKSARKIKKGSGKVVRINGKKRAVYRDDKDNLHVIGSMCPHMHGELKWNADTQCWECPCHGSRFDIYGNILSEPATKCCKYRKYE
ncbi:MAG: FAD-dependent oxidoreductase [Clostridia bacterium]|nr:FAD-dependent oxidoreductase [Clostridia bacterium]